LVDPNEVGSLDEMRFVETTNGKVFTAQVPAALMFMPTLSWPQQAYGISRISGEALRQISSRLALLVVLILWKATDSWFGKLHSSRTA